MIRVTATRELRFTGYGVRLYPGENELPDKIPYGLKKSLERRERFGQVTIEHVPDAQGEKSATGAAPSPGSAPATQARGEKRRKRRRRGRDRGEESSSPESAQPVESQSPSVAQDLVDQAPTSGLDFSPSDADPEPD